MRALSQRQKIVIFILLLLLIFPLIRLLRISPQDLLQHTPQSLPLAALLFLGVYCLKSIIMIIPLPVLYVAAGLLFPKGWAILLTYCCLSLELTLSYRIGRRLGGDKVIPLLEKHPKTARILTHYQQNQYRACFLAQFLPLPTDPAAMFFGAMKMSFIPYLLLSLLGLSPKMIPIVLAGSAVQTPFSSAFLLPLAICLVVFGGAFLLHRRLQRQHREPKENAILENPDQSIVK